MLLQLHQQPVRRVGAGPVMRALRQQPSRGVRRAAFGAGRAVDDTGLGAVPLLKGLLQVLYLQMKLFDVLCLLAAVHHSLVLDVLSPAGVIQRVEALVEVGGGWADAGYHHGLGIAPQRVLQDPREEHND